MLLNTEQIPVMMYGFQRTRGMSTLPCWTASAAATATSIVICTDGCIYNWSSYIPTQPAQLLVERCNNKSQKAATQTVQCNLTEFSLKQALLNKIMNAILTWEFGWKTIQNASSKVLLHTLAVSIFKYTIRQSQVTNNMAMQQILCTIISSITKMHLRQTVHVKNKQTDVEQWLGVW